MPRMTPVLGFPTLAYACAALRAEGLHYRDIAQQVGRSEVQVRACLGSLDRAEKPRKVVLPMELLPAFAEPADARGMTVPELALALLEVIARDDVVDALLGEPALRQAQDDREQADG